MNEAQADQLESTNLNKIKAEQQSSSNEVIRNEPEVEAPTALRKNRDDKIKKKDDRNVEQILKTLSSVGITEEKLGAMCRKYSSIVDENRKLQVQLKQYDKKFIAMQREKDQLQTEHSKTILTRNRLESLCRELQKQNKQIKEESLQRVRDEEEKRESVSNKFQSTLSEITVLMQQNNENNSKLRDENLEMQNKFKTVCEQYELREQQVEKMSKQMQLESQLAEAKLTKLKIEMVTEREVLENEKILLLVELEAYQNKCQELQKKELALNNQISMYNEKFDKFQEALSKSNQLYNDFKGEVKTMSKKIAKLEKETSVWKTRWENNHKALLQVAAEKQLKVRQLAQLQKLCRTLQADRTALMAQLKNEGITPQLSGDQNSNAENTVLENTEIENESTENTDVEAVLRENKLIENAKEEENTDGFSETEVIGDVKEAENSKDEAANDVVPPTLTNEKGDDVTKSNNAKTKKGKESSKRRKKRHFR